MPCPGDPLLSEFAQGVLEEPALTELELHLDSCPECRRRLALAAAAAADPGEDSGAFDRGRRLGRYVLVDRLGRGGMGLVLRAYDPELDRRVAIKVLDRADSEAELDSLLAEARAAARLVHPNVVVIHDVGREGARAFVAMELVEGGTLARWLKRERRPARRVLEVFRAAGEGLAAAHRAGLVHRDFKPDNVLLGSDGRPRVADFGLAHRAVPAGAGGGRGTKACGTPGYMPPEQYAGVADARADVFAFCASLWEALTGFRPFPGGDSPEALKAVQSGAVQGTLPRAVPLRVRRALLRGLAYRPEDRFSSMQELLAELAPRRATARLVLAAVLVLLAGAGAAFLAGRADPCAGGAPPSGWDAAAQAAAREAFLGTGRSFAPGAFADFDRQLQAWTRDADAQALSVCQDARRGQPEGLTEARAGCLQRALRDARALVALAVRADAAFVDHAAQAVRALPALEVCADPALARAARPLPSDPGTRREVERLNERLSSARALLEGGAWARGRSEATAVAAAAEATGFHPLIAEALVVRGSAEHLGGALVEAVATLRQAVSEADAAGQDRVRVQALALLVRVLGDLRRAPEESEAWLAVGQGALARAGNPPEFSAELEAGRSDVAFSRGDYAQAVAAMRAAVATWERLGERGTVGLARALSGLAAIEVSAGELDAAEATARRSLSVGAAAFPPGHPSRSGVLSALGGLRLRKGAAGEAVEIFATLARELEASVGPSHPDAVWASALLAIAQLGADRPAEAAASARRALGHAPADYPRRYTLLRCLGTAQVDLGEAADGVAQLEEAFRRQAEAPGRNPLDEAAGRAHLARGLLAAGRGREAAEHARAAVDGLAGKVPADSERMGLARLVLGRVLLAEGRVGEARAELAAAVAAHEKMGTYGLRRAEARFALAQATADPAEAARLAEAARADLGSLGRVSWSGELEALLARVRADRR